MHVDTRSGSDPLQRRLRQLSAWERRDEALSFVRRHHREAGLSDDALALRLRAVRRALARHGHYEHTPEELAFGARIAWRHHARCIGRLFWSSLEVVDCRDVSHPDDIAGRLAQHLRDALGDGRVRSIISVFAPIRPGQVPTYVESPQLVQYAGYARDDGSVLGDRQNLEWTRSLMALGWSPREHTMFDRLPVVVRRAGGARQLYEMPDDAVRELSIRHPSVPGIDALGLRWYTVPVVSGMIMTIGGIDYPCAPFNGFYMDTEIAARNFGDEHRYDLLPKVAQALAPDGDGQADPMWRDQALLELNRAVLHSFQADGVTMVDHHTAGTQYMEFMRRERGAGRLPSGDWAWLVPPISGSACPVFHVDVEDRHAVPNYYHAQATDGAALRPDHADETRWRHLERYERWRRRLARWQRQRL